MGRFAAFLFACALSSGQLRENRGERLFLAHCAGCHGPKGDGGRGANLAIPRLSRGADDAALANLILYGIPGTEMPGTRLNAEEVRDLSAWVRRLGQNAAPTASAAGDAARGERLYRTKGDCGRCHTVGSGGGILGPDLTDIGARRSAAYLRRALLDPEADIPDKFSQYRAVIAIPDNFLQVRLVTSDGRRITGVRLNEDPFSIQVRDFSDRVYSFWKDELAELHEDWGKSPMPSYRGVLTAAEIEDVVAYLVSLRGGQSLPGPPALAPLAEEAGDWPTYSGNYAGHRYSPLDQIRAANISRLKPVWVYQTADPNKFETTPLAVGGILYISEPPSNASALDGRTGRPLWSYRRGIPEDVRVCCGQVNRGLAMLGDSLFLGTLDAHLVALDSRTGRVRWDTTVADYRLGYSITAAPLVVKDKVLIGVAGGEYGVRGLLDAYDARTGRRAWRFWTVPGPGEPGRETWSGDSWKTGSATTWVTGSYDPDSNLVFWGTGNPGPDYNGAEREGDNLYSNCLLALDADTGKLKWHFQFTPHDLHDRDSTHVPVLIAGARKLVVVANRNGFYYVLDRLTGKFLAGGQFAKQTWAKGLDDSGRPIVLAGTAPSEGGTPVYPGVHGGTNWFSPSYSPGTGLLYVAVREEGTSFYATKPDYAPGRWFSAGGFRGLTGVEPSGSIKALQAETGLPAWEFKLHSPPWAGLLSTAGGLLFGGSNEGLFFALDARDGKPLWRFPTGGAIFSNPISFLCGGKQHVAIAAGHALFAFGVDGE